VIKVNGTTKFTTTIPTGLESGLVGVYSSGVTGKIDDVTLDVNGDTTTGNNSGEYRVGDSYFSIANFADHWDKMSKAYKDNPDVMYDLMNEWHDMPVPLTGPSTVATATSTLANQAAINAIRANGDTKYIIVEYDSYSNMHRFTEFFGSN